MDSPNSRQTRKSHADPSLLDSTSFRHGSSAEVRGRPDSPPSLIRKSETIDEVAQSMERRGGAARQDGISLAESHDCSVRHRVDASRPRDEGAQHSELYVLRQLLKRASVSAWAEHIETLGAICVRDVAEMTPEIFAPMPIIAAHRMIRFAKAHVEATEQTAQDELLEAQFRAGVEAAELNASTERAERELRDADRATFRTDRQRRGSTTTRCASRHC